MLCACVCRLGYIARQAREHLACSSGRGVVEYEPCGVPQTHGANAHPAAFGFAAPPTTRTPLDLGWTRTWTEDAAQNREWIRSLEANDIWTGETNPAPSMTGSAVFVCCAPSHAAREDYDEQLSLRLRRSRNRLSKYKKPSVPCTQVSKFQHSDDEGTAICKCR